MDPRDLVFPIVFVICLGVTAYFLGSSITGSVIETMHCDTNGCAPFCKTNFDCLDSNTACCQEKDFGICKPVKECEQAYQPTLYAEDKPLHLEQATPVAKNYTWLYATIIMIVVALAVGYFWTKR